jgi:hypothetical protein
MSNYGESNDFNFNDNYLKVLHDNQTHSTVNYFDEESEYIPQSETDMVKLPV